MFRRERRPWVVVFLLVCSCLVGCASFLGEKHYFKSVIPQRQQASHQEESCERPNYYRLEVKGQTFIASSRYVSGYFDPHAVEEYFNEFSQPERGKFRLEDKVPTGGEKVEPMNPSVQDGRLVLLLSSNSDEIAAQIKGIADSREVASSITRLANREQYSAAQRALTALNQHAARAELLLKLGDETVATLADDADEPVVESVFLQYANALAEQLGNETPFKTLQEADTWLRANRSHLVRH